MNTIDPLLPTPLATLSERTLSRSNVFLVGDLLPLCDFTSVLIAARLGALAYLTWFSPGIDASRIWSDGARAALAAAVLAPFILCDRAFVSFANGGQLAALIRCYSTRFVMFVGVVAAIGLSSQSLASLPHAWLMLWLMACLLITATTRFLLVTGLRRLERRGALAETIALVGSGPSTDRLIQNLREMRPHSIKIMGIFDDQTSTRTDCVHQATGTISDLLDLGKHHPMDWILLTQPASTDARAESIVHRLKSLAIPIGLCPQNAGLAMTGRPVSYFNGRLPAIRLADRQITRWGRFIAVIEIVLPHWVPVLVGLPFSVLKFISITLGRGFSIQKPALARNLVCTLDNYDLAGFTKIATHFGSKRFGYVVTPNADHLIRLHRDPSFLALYADAAYVLLDSQFISRLLRFTKNLRLPVCTGSDLTANLFSNVMRPDDQIVLIGGTAAQAACLAERYGVKRLAHFNPPMGFIRDPLAVEDCLAFIESHSPFRYCLLAVGAPQQEIIAQRLKTRGVALGMALCIGASINFLTGDEKRAPLWMQRSGLEWLFRLMQAPGRMAERYLIRGPQLFGLLRRTDIVLRQRAVSSRGSALDAVVEQADEISAISISPAVSYPVPAKIFQKRRFAQSRRM